MSFAQAFNVFRSNGEKNPLFQAQHSISFRRNASSNLFSTRSIQSVKGWDETLMSSQEYDLMFRVWKTKPQFDVDLKFGQSSERDKVVRSKQQNPTEKWKRLIDLRMEMLNRHV